LEQAELDKLLNGVSFLEQLINEEIQYIGVLEGFLAIEFANALAFILAKENAPPHEDKGHYFAFSELPDVIKKYGAKCRGYYISADDAVILLAPRSECSSTIKIVSRRERVGIADAIMTSLFSMFDDPSGYIIYKGKILGVLSFTHISPLADFALKKLEKLIKAGAKFIRKDDKVLETAWLRKISFGVKPILFNKIEIDFDMVERKLAAMKLRFDKEIELLKKVLGQFIDNISERVIPYVSNDKKIVGKIVTLHGHVSEYSFVIFITKLMDDYAGKACLGDQTLNIGLLLATKAQTFCVGEKEFPREKLKVDEIKTLADPKLHPLVMAVSLIAKEIKIAKFKAQKFSGITIKGKKDDINLVGLIYSKG